ncbi:ornithine cyclodeaminase family protein [Rhodoplanes sp. Z2-YC6860]|uniref:ornithine cyclodeaminase family protein n=1 Tax=Rhodoplanes sp. Z2-YC6860 TaxID=674703 RepID=UPI00078ED76E|nr:ornithine cyclodeaminase family protein [Rhodoplanes sp. Z2-YC6860]AMN41126.1 ornithine cyclodeaminase family protein [Rhodoplanes sp. Z2-YC6860]
MRILCEADVERLIEPAAAVAAMRDAYRRHAVGAMPAPGRLDLGRSTPKGSVLLLAGHSDGASFAMKANMHVYPDPGSRQRLAASMMLLWDAVRCVPEAMIATTRFNNHRTAAGLAAAVDALAPARVRKLALFGAGKIAPAAIRYLLSVRGFKAIDIVGKGSARASALADALRQQSSFSGVDIRASLDAEACAADADVIVTLTTSDTPVFPGRVVRNGALVVLAGANRPSAREADDDLISRAMVFVDHRESCVQRAGDLCIPLQSGVLSPDRIAGEIGSLLQPATPARLDANAVTVFKSMGVIGQDIALAELVVSRAEESGVGIEFDPVTGHCEMLQAIQSSGSTDAVMAGAK